MKKLFIAIAALAAMTSCSQDEVMEVAEKQAISFGSAFVGNVTRATTAADPSYSTSNALTSFNVWGTVTNPTEGSEPVAIFNNTKVNGSVGENSTWTPTTTQYWIQDAKYNFAALVNEGKVELGDDKLPETVHFEYSDGSVDLLYAKSDPNIIGKLTGNEKVNMDFDHLLSKVKFTVVNGSTAATGYSFLVKNINVIGATKATCHIPTKEWTTLNGEQVIPFSTITVNNTDVKSECKSELLLIPQSVSVSFTVDILYGTETIASHNYATTTTHTLLVGNAYNFLINVSVGEKILFTVAEYPEWVNGNTTDSDDADSVFDHIPLTSLK